LPLLDAIKRARSYVQEAIRTAPGFGHGHGPLNHMAANRAPQAGSDFPAAPTPGMRWGKI
jgi:hypothetical protein